MDTSLTLALLDLEHLDQQWELRDEQSVWTATAPCWKTSGTPCSWSLAATDDGHRSWSTASADYNRPRGSRPQTIWKKTVKRN